MADRELLKRYQGRNGAVRAAAKRVGTPAFGSAQPKTPAAVVGGVSVSGKAQANTQAGNKRKGDVFVPGEDARGRKYHYYYGTGQVVWL